MREQSTSHPDPRSPFVLDTAQLPRAPGAMREVVRTVAAPPGLGVALVGVPEGSDVHLDLRMESVTEGVLVTGTVTALAEGECGRCLRPIELPLRVPVQELFAYPDSTTGATSDDDEVARLEDNLADLEPIVRDALVLELPSTPLCQPDCPGLCPRCGALWDDLPPDHRHAEPIDPRWSALAAFQTTDQTEE